MDHAPEQVRGAQSSTGVGGKARRGVRGNTASFFLGGGSVVEETIVPLPKG